MNINYQNPDMRKYLYQGGFGLEKESLRVNEIAEIKNLNIFL